MAAKLRMILVFRNISSLASHSAPALPNLQLSRHCLCPFYCLFLPITAPPVPWVTWSDERVLGVGVHGGGHEATTLRDPP